MMKIKEKCHNPNCNRPNLINRPWRDDVFCGWCGTEYKRGVNGELIVYEINDNHIVKTIKEQCLG